MISWIRYWLWDHWATRRLLKNAPTECPTEFSEWVPTDEDHEAQIRGAISAVVLARQSARRRPPPRQTQVKEREMLEMSILRGRVKRSSLRTLIDLEALQRGRD